MTHLLPRKKYVAVLFNNETSMRLTRWAKKQGFDLSISYSGDASNDWEWHITLIYSTTEHLLPVLGVRPLPLELKVKPTDFDLFGEDKDIPVLQLEQEPLNRFRKIYQDVYDMEDAWPEWKPHISLSYLRKKWDLSHTELPDFPLIVDRIKVENVNE